MGTEAEGQVIRKAKALNQLGYWVAKQDEVLGSLTLAEIDKYRPTLDYASNHIEVARGVFYARALIDTTYSRSLTLLELYEMRDYFDLRATFGVLPEHRKAALYLLKLMIEARRKRVIRQETQGVNS